MAATRSDTARLTPNPSEKQWGYALLRGFKPNGATFSPDLIYGVRIGRTTHKFSRLPANVHDYRYFIGGGKDERSAADENFLRMLRKSVRNGRLSEPVHTMALVRCLWYYLAVRLLGVLFFRWSNGGFWQSLRALFGK